MLGREVRKRAGKFRRGGPSVRDRTTAATAATQNMDTLKKVGFIALVAILAVYVYNNFIAAKFGTPTA